jgi:hypothetical protein
MIVVGKLWGSLGLVRWAKSLGRYLEFVRECGYAEDG